MNVRSRTGIGIGWRPELALTIDRREDIDFVEIVAESYNPEQIPDPITRLMNRGVAVIPHGISLSLGGAERPDLKRVQHLDCLARKLHSPFVSEHIAFVRAGGKESGHLLPVPRTEAALKVVVENVLIAKEHLTVPLALENIATICDWQDAEIDEAEFVREVVVQTDSLVLLDVANLYANSLNHGFDSLAYLKKLPLDRIAYVHMAGGIEQGGFYHDTHAHTVCSGVHNLLKQLFELASPPRVMLERDDHFPDQSKINAELNAIKNSIESGSINALCKEPALASH